MGTVGVIANPAAGKDIRRLVAHASPTSDAAKMGVVRRAVLGAIDAGATRILVAPDRHNLSTRAVEGLDLPVTAAGVTIEVLDEPDHDQVRRGIDVEARLHADRRDEGAGHGRTDET